MSGCTVSAQHGVPLDEELLSAMGAVERKFWIDLLKQAEWEIQMAQARGENFPYVPSNSLREKHRQALAEHNGRVYCQIQHLQQVFIW